MSFCKLENAYDLTMEGMKTCRRPGYLPDTHYGYGLECRRTGSLTDLAVEIGAMAHHIFFLVPTGRAINIEGRSPAGQGV